MLVVINKAKDGKKTQRSEYYKVSIKLQNTSYNKKEYHEFSITYYFAPEGREIRYIEYCN